MAPEDSGTNPQATAALPEETVPGFPAAKSVVLAHDPPVVRARLAYGLFWLLTGCIAGPMVLVAYKVFTGQDWTGLKDLFTYVVTPVATLAGFAFGFYFANLNRD